MTRNMPKLAPTYVNIHDFGINLQFILLQLKLSGIDSNLSLDLYVEVASH